ncbi:LacI family DNA-binding transcriptional regulator [Diplocloster modestus]|uniref:LacI family transcriptional regulator n=1 Tax=Diplocloster modestus TaxID=2850322 RepID=A0ABS6K1E2_9FIRM|nr:LacI family DNA-binding transcriptional regulator [Diplocloster modestus]MBU9724670.1 LacI family transcriptional regulator [Diplocloster modestus]
MSATLKDIAEELGVSINTVSRALRDMPDISQETKDHVRETATRLGYHKNLAASRLRTNKSLILGMVVTDISNPVFSGMIKGVEKTCKRTSYTIMLGNSNENSAEETAMISSMMDHGVDGILLVPSMRNTRVLTQLKKAKIPYVILQRKFPDIATNYVQSNDVKGGNLAAEHLYKLGHRSFLYVSAPMHISSARERYEGFLSYLRDKNLPADCVQVLECDGTRSGSHLVMKQWLKQHPDLHSLSATAVFCFSDYVACGVYSAFAKYSLRIPQDISVIGYDNNEYADMMLPALTTIDIRPFQTGERAAELLLELIAAPDSQTKSVREIIIAPKLVNRKSTDIPSLTD